MQLYPETAKTSFPRSRRTLPHLQMRRMGTQQVFLLSGLLGAGSGGFTGSGGAGKPKLQEFMYPGGQTSSRQLNLKESGFLPLKVQSSVLKEEWRQ